MRYLDSRGNVSAIFFPKIQGHITSRTILKIF